MMHDVLDILKLNNLPISTMASRNFGEDDLILALPGTVDKEVFQYRFSVFSSTVLGRFCYREYRISQLFRVRCL